jgi:hypothetical protein
MPKKIISINAFESVIDFDGYNKWVQNFWETEREYWEKNPKASDEYCDEMLEKEFTSYKASIMTDEYAKTINYFDGWDITDYAITIYWYDKGCKRPAFRCKFEGAELTEIDTQLDNMTPEMKKLVKLAEQAINESEISNKKYSSETTEVDVDEIVVNREDNMLM